MNVKMCVSVPPEIRSLINRLAGRFSTNQSGAVERMAIFADAMVAGQAEGLMPGLIGKDKVREVVPPWMGPRAA